MIDLNKISIEKANEIDSDALSQISYTAKRHWNYPDDYFNIWSEELTITKDYINKNIVIKFLYGDNIIGFYSIVENKSDLYFGDIFVQKGYWLEHIFILPDYHKLGLGRLMINHAKDLSKSRGIENLLVFVDPNAKGFYEKIGADYLYDSKSSIPERLIPVFRIEIKN